MGREECEGLGQWPVGYQIEKRGVQMLVLSSSPYLLPG